MSTFDKKKSPSWDFKEGCIIKRSHTYMFFKFYDYIIYIRLFKSMFGKLENNFLKGSKGYVLLTF